MPVGMDLMRVTATLVEEQDYLLANFPNISTGQSEFWLYSSDGVPVELIRATPISFFEGGFPDANWQRSGGRYYAITRAAAGRMWIFDAEANSLTAVADPFTGPITDMVQQVLATAAGFVHYGSCSDDGTPKSFVRTVGTNGTVGSVVYSATDSEAKRPIPWSDDEVLFAVQSWTTGDPRPLAVNVNTGITSTLSSLQAGPGESYQGAAYLAGSGFSVAAASDLSFGAVLRMFAESGVNIVGSNVYTGAAAPASGFGQSSLHTNGTQMIVGWSQSASPPTRTAALLPTEPTSTVPTEFITVRPTDYVEGSSDGSAANLPAQVFGSSLRV